MGTAIQSHYLPRGAYLAAFECEDRPGFVYQYVRGKEPFQISTQGAAKERNLYALTGKGGEIKQYIEEMFTMVENGAQPVLEKTLSSVNQTELTFVERANLDTFVACQAIRTPAFIEELRQGAAQLMKAFLQTVAGNEKAFSALVSKFVEPEKTEDVRKFALEGEYDVETSGEFYTLQANKLIGPIWNILLRQRLRILVCEQPVLFTSDHPVSRIPDNAVPSIYRTGFAFSNVMLPIGPRHLLLWENLAPPLSIPGTTDTFTIPIEHIRPAEARQFSKITMQDAEEYLFGSMRNDKVAQFFNRTQQKTRVETFSTPFPGLIMTRHK